MKIGIQVPFNQHSTPEYIAAASAAIEALGFDSLWAPEHVLFFPAYASRYPYSDDGRIPGAPTGLLDPFSSLTFAAAHTSKIRLGTGICLVPQRNPVYCAKQVADLDFLSDGRFDFGVGIGWLREEFEALGVPWERRADRTLQALDVMRSLWTEKTSTLRGDFYKIEGAMQNPKPVQRPHPPIIFGGESHAALERVAATGDGWYGYNLTPDQATERMGMLAALLAQKNRRRDDIVVNVGPASDALTRAAFAEFAELGVDQIIVGAYATDLDQLQRRAERSLALMP
jgi:probable F420-dependent oxidoreductase